MSGQKLFFHTNLRMLRERQGQTQEELAAKLNFTRNKLQALESGKTVNPAIADLVLIAGNFRLSIDTLLKIDLSRLGELKLRDLMEGNDVYIRGGELRVLAITVDKQNRENAEYVPVKAKAGYRAGYADPEFVAALPRFSLPNLPRGGSFRMFPISGDSMLPIAEHSEIITRYVEDWTTLKPDTPCILILRSEQDFVFKLVTVFNDGRLLLRSLNKAYEPYWVAAADVLEIWKYYKHQTDKFPEPETGLQELKDILMEIKKKVDGSDKY